MICTVLLVSDIQQSDLVIYLFLCICIYVSVCMHAC